MELESDSHVLVKAATGAKPGPSLMMKVVEGIRMELRSFRFWSISHVHRQGNFATHIMARDACNSLACCIWVEDTPPVIANQFQRDVIDEDFGPK